MVFSLHGYMFAFDVLKQVCKWSVNTLQRDHKIKTGEKFLTSYLECMFMQSPFSFV